MHYGKKKPLDIYAQTVCGDVWTDVTLKKINSAIQKGWFIICYVWFD